MFIDLWYKYTILDRLNENINGTFDQNIQISYYLVYTQVQTMFSLFNKYQLYYFEIRLW